MRYRSALLALVLWAAPGCSTAGTDSVPKTTEKDVLPFDVSIGGKKAVFDPATADGHLVGRLPAAHVEDPVACDAEVRVFPRGGAVRQVFARCIQVDDGGNQVSREENIGFQRGATNAKLNKLRAAAKYGMIVSVLIEGSAKGSHARIRFETW